MGLQIPQSKEKEQSNLDSLCPTERARQEEEKKKKE